jgi:TatD DNase family protein
MSFKYIDIHTHLNLEQFEHDAHAVGEHTLEEGVAYINVGTGEETSARALALARSAKEGVYATVGMHPTHAGEGEVFTKENLQKLAEDTSVVAIGECGFDYFRVEKDTKKKQEEVFIQQIELANKLQKPLMLHIRPSVNHVDAYEDALSVIKCHANVLGNVHFFAGTYDIAKQFWDIGYTTSFTGVITFTDQYHDVIQKAPLSMLHGETDAPYVAPVPYRGKRNEPLHVREVYRKIAEIRGVNEEDIRIQLLENAQRLFNVTL